VHQVGFIARIFRDAGQQNIKLLLLLLLLLLFKGREKQNVKTNEEMGEVNEGKYQRDKEREWNIRTI
jgi:hypothetical protein